MYFLNNARIIAANIQANLLRIRAGFQEFKTQLPETQMSVEQQKLFKYKTMRNTLRCPQVNNLKDLFFLHYNHLSFFETSWLLGQSVSDK